MNEMLARVYMYIIVLLRMGLGGIFSVMGVATCRKRMGTLIFVLTALALISPQASSDANARTFAVVGDSRGTGYTSKDGVNLEVLKKIAEHIKDRKCDLVVFPGDLIQGSKNHSEQYKGWMDAMQPVLNARIPVYPVRGNHEEWGDTDAKQWRKFVSEELKNVPQDGPTGENLCTYSFTHNNALFIAVDEYFNRKGTKHTINQGWLNTQLQNNDRNTHPHVFVYAHTPAFQVSGSSGSTGALYDDPGVRHTLWASLRGHGVRA